MNRKLPLVLAVALFMENMDSTVIATALPAIAEEIGTSPVALKLALTAYLVSLAIFIPVSAWMAARFGAKNVFRVAILVFIIGSICSALSWSLGSFVVSRFIQGMGGAMMTPLARLILFRSTSRSELIAAMAWLTVPGLIGPMAGPPVGGFLATYVSWHWIFLINVPIGLLGIWVAGRVLPDIPREPTPPLDTTGFLLAGLAAAGVVFGLSVVSLPALPPAIGFATMAAGFAAGAFYVRHSRRTANPLLDLSLFSNRVFRSVILGSCLFRIGSGAVPFLLPLMFQLVFGMTPFQSGLITFTSAFGAFFIKFLTARALKLGGFKTVVLISSVGGCLLVGAQGLFTPQTPYAVILAVLVSGGLLRSLFFTSTNALVFAEVSDEEAAQATAIAAVAQQVSVALGVAVGGGILEVALRFSGQGLEQGPFMIAFFGVATIALLAAVPFFSLPRDAGSDMSGHRRRRRAAPAEPPPES